MKNNAKKKVGFLSVSLLGILMAATSCGATPTVQVILDANFEGSTKNIYTVRRGNQIEEGTLPTPDREGYTFSGWFTDEKAETRYDYSTVVEKQFTLFAGWTVAPSN